MSVSKKKNIWMKCLKEEEKTFHTSERTNNEFSESQCLLVQLRTLPITRQGEKSDIKFEQSRC